MGNYNQYKNVNTIFGGVGAIQLPAGNATTQRPGGGSSDAAAAVAGQIRFNTITNRVEQYTGTSWLTLDAPPLLLSVSPNQIQPSEEGSSGTLLTLTGSNFSTDATVTLNGGTYNAITVTSATGNSITARIPGGVPIGIYNIAVVNGSGLSSTLTSGFTVDTSPVWTTPAGSVGTVTNGAAITTIPLAATDPDGNSTITYAVTANSLPTGLSLSSSGNITGTPTGYVSSQTVSFTVTATSTQNASGSVATTPRVFSITVNLPATISSLSTTSGNAGSSFTINGTNFTGTPTVTIGGVAASVSSVTSTSLVATVPVTVPVNYVVGKPTLSGGSNWFDSSNDYFGVDPSMRLQNGVKYTSVTWRLPNTQASASNYWWPHIVTKTAGQGYTTAFAAKILCPVGNNGDVVTVQFSAAATKVGFDGDGLGFTVPASGDYFLAWRSGNSGTNNPGGSLWADFTSEAYGCVQYVRTDGAVALNGTYTTTSAFGTSGLIHIQFNAAGHNVTLANSAVATNGVTQTPPAVTAGQTFTRTFNTTAFGYTGADQSFSVPTGVTKIEAKIWGAGGGGGNQGGWANGSNGAAGGFTFSSITTTPGESLTIVVGRQGVYAPQPYGPTYGGGGGMSSNGSNGDNRYGGSGGGLSGVFRGSFAQGNSLAIAGGGGGGGASRNGNTCRGGAGGGSSGSGGSAGQGTGPGGGTQSGGGGGGSYGNAGSAINGGNSPSGNPYGGGGGGGYFGGGSGGYAEPNGMNGGGGGSGYISSQAYGQTTTGTDPGTGLNPRNYTDPDYGGSAGVGGGGSTDSGASSGGNGRVVIRY